MDAITNRIEDTDAQATGNHRCTRCAGTGQFITMVVNGRPTGPGGACYRCGGKGFHNNADRRRNWGYTRYQLGNIAASIAHEHEQATGGEHVHDYHLSRTCGVDVCNTCRDHKGLARCFCGWSRSGGDGYRELVEMGEQVEDDY